MVKRRNSVRPQRKPNDPSAAYSIAIMIGLAIVEALIVILTGRKP